MKKILFTCAFLFISSLAQAQDPTTNYELTMVGATTTTYGFTRAQAQCNQTVEPGAPGTINPRYLVWDDVINAGRICVHDTGNGTGPLFALPIGDYSANLVAIAATGTNSLRSGPSNTVSFTRLAQPAARTGFRVRGAQ